MKISKNGKEILKFHGGEELYGSGLSFFGRRVTLFTNLKDVDEEFNSSFRHMIGKAGGKKEGKNFFLYEEKDGRFNLILPTHQNLNFEGREILFPLFMSIVNSFVLPEIKDMLIFHSAAVSVDGRGVIIPGSEASGKTTLTAALLERGFTYFSDEYAGFEYGELSLLPFPKSLFMREKSLGLFNGKREILEQCSAYNYRNEKRWIVDPNEVFGAHVGKKSSPQFIVFLKPNYGRKSDIREIPSYEVLTRILETSRNSVYLSQAERKDFFEKVLTLVRKTAGFELTVGMPGEASAILLDAVKNAKIKIFNKLPELEAVAEKVRSMI